MAVDKLTDDQDATLSGHAAGAARLQNRVVRLEAIVSSRCL